MTSNQPDPRLDGRVLTYDPESIKTALKTYYQALSKLPYVNEIDIIYPPAGGWPNITTSNFAPLGKTDAVIDLLKHLSYLRNPDMEKGYAISFGTFPIDYSAKPFGVPVDTEKAVYLSPDFAWPEEKIKSWVVPLTVSEDRIWGLNLLLDTTDGTVTAWDHNDSSEKDFPEYPPEDPRAWRNTCGETWKLEELLEEWTKKFESLHWVAFTDPTGRAKVWNDEDWPKDKDTEECEELQEIIRNHGWPGDGFRREECQGALCEWVESKQG